MCNYRHKYNCSTVTPIKKLTFHAGNMCREWSAIPGGEDRIYVKRDWFGTVMDKNIE